jgi:hypothetical protein
MAVSISDNEERQAKSSEQNKEDYLHTSKQPSDQRRNPLVS